MEEESIIDTICLQLSRKEKQINKKALSNSNQIDAKSQPTAIFASLFTLIQTEIAIRSKQQKQKKEIEENQDEDKITEEIDQDNLNNDNNLDSLMLLMNIIIPKLKVPVFKKFIQNIQKNCLTILNVFQKFVALRQYTIAVLIETLQVLSPQEIISDSNIKLLLNNIIEISIKDNKITRKEAQKGIKLLLEQKTGLKQMLGDLIRQQIIDTIQQNEQEVAIQSVVFFNFLITVLPTEVIGDIVYILLKQLLISTEELQVHIYLAIENLMAQRPLTVDISETILKECLNNQPSFYQNQKLVFSYTQCTIQTLLHINTFEPRTSRKYISSCLALLQEIMVIENDKQQQMALFAQNTSELLILNCINANLWGQSSYLKYNKGSETIENFIDEIEDLNFEGDKNEQGLTQFKKIVAMIAHFLSSRFENVTDQALSVIGAFFEKIDKQCLEEVKHIIIQIVEQRQNYKSQSFISCLSKLIENIGIEFILDLFPMNLEGDPSSEDFESKGNLWIINLILNVQKTNNSFSAFIKYIIPMIQKINNMLQQHNQNQQSTSFNLLDKVQLQKKIFYDIQQQLWNCFQKFTNVDKKIKEELEQLDLFLASIGTQIQDTLPYFSFIIKGLDSILKSCIEQNTPQIDNILKAHSQALIGCVAKVVMPGKKHTVAALNIIQKLSYVAPKDYLDKAFTKNIQKLILEKQQDTLSKNQVVNLKNFDILLAVSKNVDVRDQKQTLSFQLVKLFLEDNSVFQKKGYKMLLILIEKIHSSQLHLVLDLIKQYDEFAQSFSRPVRLQIIELLWKKMKFNEKDFTQIEQIGEFTQQFLPELIIGMRQSNRKSNKHAETILVLISEKMQSFNTLKDFISMIAAGLAGESSLMKADSIVALSFLIDKYYQTLQHSFLKDIKQLVLLLLKEQNKEIMKAIILFCRNYIKKLNKDTIYDELPEMLKVLYEQDENLRNSFRNPLKYLVYKLIKKFGEDKIELIMPSEHKKLVKSIVRQERRNKTKKSKDKQENNLKFKKDAFTEDYEREVQDRVQKENSEQSINQNLLLKYDNENEQFHFVEHQVKSYRDKIQSQKQEVKEIEYIKGKIIVREQENEETGKKRKREDRFSDFNNLQKEDEDSGIDDEEENKKEIKDKQHQQQQGNNQYKKSDVHIIKESGSTYKPKNSSTGGDLLIKGKPQPYAFIQLSHKALNKRFRNKSIKAFDTVLTKKDGALKGLITKKVKTE